MGSDERRKQDARPSADAGAHDTDERTGNEFIIQCWPFSSECLRAVAERTSRIGGRSNVYGRNRPSGEGGGLGDYAGIGFGT